MSAWFWIIPGILAAALLAGSGKSKGKNSAGSAVAGRDSRRIDHLHYMDPDEYECPKCGARFGQNVMVCPKCGTRFTGTKEDDEAFIEEMELWEEDDDG